MLRSTSVVDKPTIPAVGPQTTFPAKRANEGIQYDKLEVVFIEEVVLEVVVVVVVVVVVNIVVVIADVVEQMIMLHNWDSRVKVHGVPPLAG